MELPVTEFFAGDYLLSTDRARMDVRAIHRYLATDSYWAPDIPFDTVETAVSNSFCIGAFLGPLQVGFARFVTDYATFAYLADVYVLPEHRGKGLSKAMMQVLMNLDWVAKLRKLSLATRDAHELYLQYGFSALAKPERHMEIVRPGIYTRWKEEK